MDIFSTDSLLDLTEDKTDVKNPQQEKEQEKPVVDEQDVNPEPESEQPPQATTSEENNNKEEEKSAPSNEKPKVITDLSKLTEEVKITEKEPKEEQASKRKLSRKEKKRLKAEQDRKAAQAARKAKEEKKEEKKAPQAKQEEKAPEAKEQQVQAKKEEKTSKTDTPVRQMSNLDVIKKIVKTQPGKVQTGMVTQAYMRKNRKNDGHHPEKWKVVVNDGSRNFFVWMRPSALSGDLYPIEGSVVSFKISHDYSACNVEGVSMKNAATELIDFLENIEGTHTLRIVHTEEILRIATNFTTEIGNNVSTEDLGELIADDLGVLVGSTRDGRFVVVDENDNGTDDDSTDDEDDNA